MNLVVELYRSVGQFHQTDVVIISLSDEFGMSQNFRDFVLLAHQIASRFAGVVHDPRDVVGAQSHREMRRWITVTSWIAQTFVEGVVRGVVRMELSKEHIQMDEYMTKSSRCRYLQCAALSSVKEIESKELRQDDQLDSNY